MTAVLKVETDIITSIAASWIGPSCDNVCWDLQNWCYYFYRYVETFKIDVIIFIDMLRPSK